MIVSNIDRASDRARVAVLFLLAIGIGASAGCKKSGGGSSSADSTETATETDTSTSTETVDDVGDDDDDDEVQGSGTAALTLGHSYPEGLTLAVLPPVVSDAPPASLPAIAGTLAIPAAELALDDELPVTDAPQSTLEKIEDSQAKLQGEGECFSLDLLNSAPANLPNCYTPDTDLDFNTAAPGTPDPRPTDTQSGEACLASYARAKAAATVAMVDRATGIFLAMLCQAKKGGMADAAPAIDESIDLKAQVTTALAGVSGLNVTLAQISRLADHQGNPVLKTEITIEYTGNGNPGTRLEEIKALHSPDATVGNSKYIGRLWIRSGSTAGQNPLQTDYLALDYARTGTDEAPRLQTLVVQGAYVQDTVSAADYDVLASAALFDAEGHLDLSADADFTKMTNDPLYGHWAADSMSGNGLNNTMGSSQLIASDANILTGEGKLAYWQNYGGNYAESARGMIFNLSLAGDDQRLSGCVISGATFGEAGTGDVSIRRAQHEEDFGLLVPGGYYHPQGTDFHPADPNSTLADLIAMPSYVCDQGLCQKAPFVYRQCFAQADDGKYMIDTAAMSGNNYQLLPATAASVTAVESPDYAAMPNLAL